MVAFMQQQVQMKVNIGPPEPGTAEAAQSEAEWAARWQRWMDPFELRQRESEDSQPAAGVPAAVAVPPQKLPPNRAAVRQRVVKLSDRPNVWACPEFCTSDECDALVRLGSSTFSTLGHGHGWSPSWSGREIAKTMLQPEPELEPEPPTDARREEHRLYALLKERASFLTQAEGDAEGDWAPVTQQLTFQAPEDAPSRAQASLGLHVDTSARSPCTFQLVSSHRRNRNIVR